MSWQAWTAKPCSRAAAKTTKQQLRKHFRQRPESGSFQIQDCRHLVGHLERYSEVTGEDTHPRRQARRLKTSGDVEAEGCKCRNQVPPDIEGAARQASKVVVPRHYSTNWSCHTDSPGVEGPVDQRTTEKGHKGSPNRVSVGPWMLYFLVAVPQNSTQRHALQWFGP